MAKMQIIFDGFENLAYKIDAIGNDLQAAVDEALKATSAVVRTELDPAVAVYADGGIKGYATGKMYDTRITDDVITWKGTVAEIGTGFSSANMAGFMHSIFVMYGTPKMDKNPKIYNALKGTKVRKRIAEVQEEVMLKHLNLGE